MRTDDMVTLLRIASAAEADSPPAALAPSSVLRLAAAGFVARTAGGPALTDLGCSQVAFIRAAGVEDEAAAPEEETEVEAPDEGAVVTFDCVGGSYALPSFAGWLADKGESHLTLTPEDLDARLGEFLREGIALAEGAAGNTTDPDAEAT